MSIKQTKLLLPLLLTPLLFACSKSEDAGKIQHGNIATLLSLDDSIITLPMEVARQSAVKAQSKIAISPGKYCLDYVQPTANGPSLQGRIELTITDKNYTLAKRFVNGDLVRSSLQGGVYEIQGQGLILHNRADQEIIIPIDGTTSDTIDRWGELPLSRSACTSPSLQGADFNTQFAAKNKEQLEPFPWQATK